MVFWLNLGISVVGGVVVVLLGTWWAEGSGEAKLLCRVIQLWIS